MMEDGEEEQLELDDIIAQYGDFGDTATGEDEAGAEGTPVEDDALGGSFVMHRKTAKVKKRRQSLTTC